MKRLLAVPLIGILGAISFLWALTPPATENKEDDFTIRNEVRLVLLDVSVQSHDGNFVTGLSKSNFTVLENGQPQPISVFDNGDSPVTMGLLVDESGSMSPKRDQVLTAAQKLVMESNHEDEVFVLNFNDSVKRGLPAGVLFSDNIPQLGAALRRERPAGKTALYDAVTDGLLQLEQGRRGRKTLIIISDGGDNASAHKRAETIALVERSPATIYAVGLAEPDDYESDLGILRQFAKISGGRAFFPDKIDGIAGICHTFAKEIRARYTVGYVPREDKHAASVRHIRVKVSGHDGLTVLTRTSYRYDKPQSK